MEPKRINEYWTEAARPLLDWMAGRHAIYLARAEGLPAPWTDDPILRHGKFTNVDRELDATTVWFQNVRDRVAADPVKALRATVIFRMFNRIEPTGVLLLQHGLFDDWSSERAREVLVPPFVTGAFIIRTPNGVGISKRDGVLQIIDSILPHAERLAAEIQCGRSIERAVKLFAQFDYIGGFMGYEFATDLTHTVLLRDATDALTYANPGPGATRALGRLFGRKVNMHSGDPAQRRWCVERMREVRSEAERELPEWIPRPITMRMIEHSLCELGKYLLAQDAVAAGLRPDNLKASFAKGCPNGCDWPWCPSRRNGGNGGGHNAGVAAQTAFRF